MNGLHVRAVTATPLATAGRLLHCGSVTQHGGRQRGFAGLHRDAALLHRLSAAFLGHRLVLAMVRSCSAVTLDGLCTASFVSLTSDLTMQCPSPQLLTLALAVQPALLCRIDLPQGRSAVLSSLTVLDSRYAYLDWLHYSWGALMINAFEGRDVQISGYEVCILSEASRDAGPMPSLWPQYD